MRPTWANALPNGIGPCEARDEMAWMDQSRLYTKLDTP
jgi:hypothetical protein